MPVRSTGTTGLEGRFCVGLAVHVERPPPFGLLVTVIIIIFYPVNINGHT